MNVITMTWGFRVKLLGRGGRQVLHKARCRVRGDFKIAEIDYDPFGTYAPVVCHESVRIYFDHSSTQPQIT